MTIYATSFRRVLAMCFVLLALGSVSAWAQSTGSIGGTVTDNAGAPLPGALVSIEGTSLRALTEDNGEYVILNITPGNYSVTASYIGFQKQTQNNVKVSVDQRTRTDFTLSTGTEITTDVVEIEAERRGIDVEQSGRLIEAEQIQNTGIKQLTNIVSKTAGVVTDERGQNINIRGGRNNENIIIVDGVERVNPLDGTIRANIPTNSVQEIAVLTGGFGAEYGNVLSGVINVSTKSGSEVYTGSIEAVTDEFAGDWIGTNSQGYNLYNVTLGGPIIPTKKLKNSLNFFLSFQRTFQRVTDVSWITDQLPTILPDGKLKDNETGTYSYDGRVTLDFANISNNKVPFILRLGGSIYNSKGREFNGPNLIQNSERNPVIKDDDYQFFGRLTHNVSNKFFYELQGSYFTTFNEQYDPIFGDDLYAYGDSLRNTSMPRSGYSANGTNLGQDPGKSFLANIVGAVRDFYSKQDIRYFSAKADATWALLTKKYGDHEIKFGGEMKFNSLKKFELFPSILSDESITDPIEKYWGTNNARLDSYGYLITDPRTGATISGGEDTKKPITGGFYLRDKVSFDDFNFNGGLRVDYFDVNDFVLKNLTTDLVGDDGVLISDDDFEKAKAEIIVSPRLGFSFPITDRTVFVAQYGKMVQLPQLDLLFASRETLRRFFATSLQDVIENSSLKPTKVTQYEVGFKQTVGDYLNLGISAFYKESTDLIGAGRVVATDDGKVPAGFATYLNIDFAISRGFDFYLSLRRINRLSADISYTLAYASGTGSDAFSRNSLANDPTQELPNFVYALDYDQRHTGNINIDYRFGQNDVPKGFAGEILRNAGINLLFSFNSGRPYTQRLPSQSATGQGERSTSAKNEIYTNWNYRLDARLNKVVNIWKTNWDFYIYAINLLNTETINSIFPSTGRPDDNGFLNTPTGASRFENDPVFRQYYPERIKLLRNWGPPRQIRFGVSVNF